MRADDLDFFAELANTVKVRGSVVGWDWPVSPDAQREWFANSIHDTSSRRFTVTEVSSDRPVGLAGLWAIDWHNRSAAPAVKLMPGLATKGAGSDSMMLIAAWSFHDVGLRRLHTTILDSNAASLAMCVRRCGWQVEGRAREAVFRRGEWQDLIQVALLRQEFDAHPLAREYIERVCGPSVEHQDSAVSDHPTTGEEALTRANSH